jgi:hypothetical protein
MKTIENKLIQMLVSHGMGDGQAKEAMKFALPRLKENTDLEDYKINYQDSEGSYPLIIYNTLFSILKPLVLEWIELNKPLAWYKPVFQ